MSARPTWPVHCLVRLVVDKVKMPFENLRIDVADPTAKDPLRGAFDHSEANEAAPERVKVSSQVEWL